MAEAEARVRKSFRNRKGAEVFVNSERTKIFNKLLGIEDPTAGYRVYSAPKVDNKTQAPKAKTISGEGDIDVSAFNKL